jgi:hypothetical protein
VTFGPNDNVNLALEPDAPDKQRSASCFLGSLDEAIEARIAANRWQDRPSSRDRQLGRCRQAEPRAARTISKKYSCNRASSLSSG